MAEIEKELRHYLEGDVEPRAALEWSRETQRGDGRPEVLRPARHVAARDAAGRLVRRVGVRRGPRLRRLLDPRLAGDRGERHDPDAGRVDGDPRPVHRGADALAALRDRGARDATRRTPRIRAASRSARRSTCARPASPTRATSAPSASSSSSTRSRTRAAPNEARYKVDSSEGHWNSGDPGLGYTIREKQGYFPPAPHDTLSDLRTRMVLTLERLGVQCEFHHHEVASAGQCEIDLRFESLTRMADQVLLYKYVIKNTALAAGKSATFMPKPIFGDNGSGMHCHQSLWKEGTPLFADKSGPGGALAARARVRRRPARARAGAARVLRADDELVPPARAGLRGAGQPRVLVAQPQRVHPHPDLQRVAEGEAHRVPLPGPDREPVPRVLGDADGGPRRDRARPRPGRAVATSTSSRTTAASRRCRARSPRRSTRSRPTTRS